jgi:hypothetical protein
VVVHRQPKLPHVINALHAASCLAGALNSGKQQAYQNSDDRDNNQQLDQSKPASGERFAHLKSPKIYESTKALTPVKGRQPESITRDLSNQQPKCGLRYYNFIFSFLSGDCVFSVKFAQRKS